MDTIFKDERLFFLYSNNDSLNDEYFYQLEKITFEAVIEKHFNKLRYDRIL